MVGLKYLLSTRHENGKDFFGGQKTLEENPLKMGQ